MLFWFKVFGINRNSPSRSSVKVVLPPVIPCTAKDGSNENALRQSKIQGIHQINFHRHLCVKQYLSRLSASSGVSRTVIDLLSRIKCKYP